LVTAWLAERFNVYRILVGPVITGLVVDRTGQFVRAFAIAAGVAVLGVVGWGPMIRKAAPLDWDAAPPARQPLRVRPPIRLKQD
jgi:hypothetical protein